MGMFSSKKNVDTVIASFSKVVDDLIAIEASSLKEVADIEVKVADLIKAKDAANDEASRATAIATKIKALLSV